MKPCSIWTVITWLSFSTLAAAAPFDGSSPFLCAAMQTRLCSSNTECELQGPKDNDVPRFLRISVQNRKVTGVRPSGAVIDASIETVRRSKETMFLQGTQDPFAWEMAIGMKDGNMTLTAVDSGNGMVIFGACTLP